MVNVNQLLKAQIFGDGMLSNEDRYSKIKINHIPIMITENNRILCLPTNEETTHIGFCYDKETEVLTNKGFKKFSELDKTELIAQVDNKTFEIDFVKPLNYVKQIYSGEMIHFKSKTINLLVTPTHNMFVRNRRDTCTNFNSWKFLPAHRMLKGDWRIPQACSKNKKPILNEMFPVELFGFWLAEGCKYGKNKIEVYQSEKNLDILIKVREMLSNKGIPFKEINHGRVYKGNYIKRIIIDYPEMANYVSIFGKAKEKFIPEWIKNNTNETIQKFLDWFFLGDGSLSNGRKMYHTASKQLASDIQECLLRIGVTSSIYKYINNFDKKSIMYRVAERDNTHATIWSKENKKIVNYNDYVYCVEVPTHLLVVRRMGRVALCGNTAMTGKGKGIGGNTLLGFEYWMTQRLCMILNDFQQETFENSLPCMNRIFWSNLKMIGIYPKGYPLIYVYPSNKNLIIGEVEKLFPHIKMSLPTRVVIQGIENYYKLDKSAKYVTGYIDRFLGCKDLQEIEEVIDGILMENFPDQKGKKYEEMKFKIKVIFKNIFDEEITDSASPDAPAFLRIKKKGNEYYNFTIQALLAAGLIPSIQTSEIRTKPWFSAYMAFIVESIYKDKYKDPFLKHKYLSMYVPEIDKMWKGEKGDLIKTALSLIGTNGRRAGIGLRWDAQDYDAVPDAIRSNTKYLFVLRKSNAEEVRGIVKDFSISKEAQEWILKLETEPEKGKFECVALTTDKFILYNLRDGSMSTTSMPQKGRLITPMAEHKVPGRKIDEVIA